MIARLVVSYRGTRYGGWQRQDNAPTVQEALERALSNLLEGNHRVTGASRTDAGVHARAQSVHLELAKPFPLRGLIHGTNHRLPDDIRVLAAASMPSGFHARRCSSGKEYAYHLMRLPVLSPLDALFAVRAPLIVDLEAVRAATAHLIGRHDFSAFALAGGSHQQPMRRIIAARWEESGPRLTFRIEGEGFLRGMVRSLVGSLLEVGAGRRSAENFAALLGGASRGEAGPTAVPQGLILERVDYPPEWQALETVER
jgi:tRNA pseudouridine38-40 synthase